MLIRAMAECCGCCCQCCYAEDSPAYQRSYRHDNYNYGMSPGFWMCFWCTYPTPTPHYHHHGGHSSGCNFSWCSPCCCCDGCSPNDCTGDRSENNGSILVVIILILAVIGLVISVSVLVVLFTQMYARYHTMVQRYRDAQEKRV